MYNASETELSLDEFLADLTARNIVRFKTIQPAPKVLSKSSDSHIGDQPADVSAAIIEQRTQDGLKALPTGKESEDARLPLAPTQSPIMSRRSLRIAGGMAKKTYKAATVVASAPPPPTDARKDKSRKRKREHVSDEEKEQQPPVANPRVVVEGRTSRKGKR